MEFCYYFTENGIDKNNHFYDKNNHEDAMIPDTALQVLYSRDPRALVISGYGDLPEFFPSRKMVKWQQNHTDKHAQREILLMLSGSTVVHLNGKYYKVPPGGMVFFNRQDIHTYGFPPGSRGLACCLVILGKDLQVNIVDTAVKPFKYLSKQFIKRFPVTDILEKVWDKISGPLDDEAKQAFLTEIACSANLIFAEIWRKVKQLPDPLPAPKRSVNAADAVKRVRKYLQDHCGATVQELAHVAGYSPTHFVRLFRQHTELGVKEYINLIRKEKAGKFKNLVPPKQLAEMLGFSSSAAYFHWRDNTNKRFARQLVTRPEKPGKRKRDLRKCRSGTP